MCGRYTIRELELLRAGLGIARQTNLDDFIERRIADIIFIYRLMKSKTIRVRFAAYGICITDIRTQFSISSARAGAAILTAVPCRMKQSFSMARIQNVSFAVAFHGLTGTTG